MISEPCQFLQWDTDFFGHRIGRVNGKELDADILASIYDWSEQNHIDCLYYLAESNDRGSIRLAENHQFQLVEIRLIFERWLKDWNPDSRLRSADEVSIRDAKPGDVPILKSIARTSYVDSRYYFDEHFSEEKWGAYYAAWVEKSCTGGAEMALAAERAEEVVGYITAVVNKDKREAMYELTGVREDVRKLGVGNELFRSGLDRFVRQGIQYVWLATQGRNVPTQRMIQRNGFITRSCQLYYHKWFTSP